MNKKTFKPLMTITVTRYKESTICVESCLESLKKQRDCNVDVLFLDQQDSVSTKVYVNSLVTENVNFRYIRIPAKSLSFARNFGLQKARTKYIGFCDVDCILENNWCNEIVNTFLKYNDVAIVGTKIVPMWAGKKKWLHNSKFIQEFYSLLDVSKKRTEVSKIVGASFAVDKLKLGNEGYFDENLGRKEGNFLGGEETDLCQRVRSKGGKVVYSPFTAARHQISNARLTYIWIQKRAYFGGLSRALRKGKAEPFNKTYGPIDCLAILFIFPAYLYGYFVGFIKYKNA